MDLFGIKKELQFQTCNHDELPEVPKGSSGELLIEEIGEGVIHKQRVHALSFIELMPGNIYILQVGLCYCYMERERPVF